MRNCTLTLRDFHLLASHVNFTLVLNMRSVVVFRGPLETFPPLQFNVFHIRLCFSWRITQRRSRGWIEKTHNFLESKPTQLKNARKKIFKQSISNRLMHRESKNAVNLSKLFFLAQKHRASKLNNRNFFRHKNDHRRKPVNLF